MACLGSVQSLHLRDAIAGAAVTHRSSSLGRVLRPAVLQVQAAQALQGKVRPGALLPRLLQSHECHSLMWAKRQGSLVCTDCEPAASASAVYAACGQQGIKQTGDRALLSRTFSIAGSLSSLSATAQVVSAKNDKTIIINFDSFKEHPLYRKRVRKTSRIVAHDEEGKAGLGDYVRIVPCAPVSKTKRFRLDAIVKKFGYIVDEVRYPSMCVLVCVACSCSDAACCPRLRVKLPD
jgi:small subunit ribosomal protein S17